MFESQIMICSQNISNLSTKNQASHLSNHKEKTLSLFSKKLPLEHREFGNDLTNLALTVFEKSNIASNQSILKALQIIKANAKNKERSREKSLIKNRQQNSLKNSKNKGKEAKIRRQNGSTMAVERKRSKNDIKKNDKIRRETSINNETNYTSFTSEYENINNISEFNLNNEENYINNELQDKDEESQKDEYINKIKEVNIKLDKENIPVNHNINKNVSNNYFINNKYNLQYVEEYQDEIIEYLLSLEGKKKINPNYMKEQKDINEKMRIILIDWLIEVHLKFKLLPETLFLTINFIDRYLQKNQTPRDKLQLIAVSSLLIACKYEEIYPPEISSFVYITDNAYKKEEILDYEIKILSSLDYDVTYPTPYRYLEVLVVKLGLVDDETLFFKMQYLLELSLSKLCFYNYTYLELVISCCLFLFENDFNIIQKILISFDLCEKYDKLEKIKSCIYDIKQLLEYINENKSAFKGIKQKFATENFGYISKIKFI